MVTTAAARSLASWILAPLPRRWAHTRAVALRAAEVCGTVAPAERELLVAAAWLHDIGYGPAASDTGFHPLDGARLLQRMATPPRLVALVAHHSGASFIAEAAGFADALAEFPDEASAVTDALLYADQTSGAGGERLPAAARIDAALTRHGPDSAQARAARLRTPYLLAAVERVQERLAQASGRADAA
jgi:putative nucleotidyltransferase with HDIG domain